MAYDKRFCMDDDELKYYKGNLRHVQEKYDEFLAAYGDGTGEKARRAHNAWCEFLIRLLGRRIEEIIKNERSWASEYDKDDYRQNARDQIIDKALQYNPYHKTDENPNGSAPVTFFEPYIRQMFRTTYTTVNGKPKAKTLNAMDQNIQFINKCLIQRLDDDGDSMYPDGIKTPGLTPELVHEICKSTWTNGQKSKPLSLTTINSAIEYANTAGAMSLDNDHQPDIAAPGASPMDKVIKEMNAEKIKTAVRKLNPFQLMTVQMICGIDTKKRNPHQICVYLNSEAGDELFARMKDWWPRKRHVTESDIAVAYSRSKEILASQPEVYRIIPRVAEHVDIVITDDDEQITAEELMNSPEWKMNITTLD